MNRQKQKAEYLEEWQEAIGKLQKQKADYFEEWQDYKGGDVKVRNDRTYINEPYMQQSRHDDGRMTREQAVKWVKFVHDVLYEDKDEEIREALNMAIEALQDDWIPVSERLPEKNGNYIVSLEDAVDTYATFFNGKWFMSSVDFIAREYGEHEVFAWRPLPEPYEESEE